MSLRRGASRSIALALIFGTAALGVGLLAASQLPTDALVARLLGAAGEAERSGALTQQLLAHFGERLRFAGVCSLAPAAALALLLRPLEQMLEAALADARTGFRRHIAVDRAALAPGAATLVALALRLAFVNQPMRYDEALSFNELASRPLDYGLSYYPDPNNHLLNTLLEHLAYAGLGNQPWVLRLPALLAGVLLVPATYWLARLLYPSRATALLAAALVATSSYLVDYSTNARGYTLQALCFVVMLGLVEIAVQRQSRTALLLAAIVAALGMYALPTMLYGIAIAACWFWLRRRAFVAVSVAASLATTGLLVALLTFLLYLPVVLISGPEVLVANRFVVPLDPGALASELPRTLARTWSLWNRDVPWPLGALLVVGFGAAVVNDVRRRRVTLGLLAPAVCLALVLLQRVAPFERVWLFLLPVYFVVASGGLGRAGYVAAPIAAAAMAAAVLTSGAILASPETGVFPDAEAVARSLRGQLQPDDAVVTLLPASLPQLQYYFPRAGLPVDVLVREPAQAVHVYVVTAPGTQPEVAGWRTARIVATFPTATLVELERS